MCKRRSHGHTLIFNDQIYVFGGYTGKGKRSKSIEKYNSKLNTWT